MLLPQTELTLNLLHQATIAPYISEWEYYNGPINYDATPFSPIGCKVAIYNKPGPRKTWDFRARDGFSIGSALHHYRCNTVIDNTTKVVRIRDTVNFYHSYLMQPTVTPEDRIVHALYFLLCAIKYVPATLHTDRLEDLTCIRDIFLPPPLHHTQPAIRDNPPEAPRVLPQRPTPPVSPPSPVHTPDLPPRVDTLSAPPAIPPRIAIGNQSTPDHPVSHHTSSRTILPMPPPAPQTPDPPIAHRTRAHTTGIDAMDFPVINEDTAQLMEYRQLRKHPKYAATWTTSYSNETGRLCQGIGKNTEGTGKRVKVTDTFFVIHYHDIPSDRRKEITCTSVVCKVRPQK